MSQTIGQFPKAPVQEMKSLNSLRLCVFWKVKTPYKHLEACVRKLSPTKNLHEVNFRSHRVYSELRYEFKNSSLRS